MEEADFSGYATKAGLKCSDGRTITPDAFRHQDTMTVPLVWQHMHNDPGNVLGHAVLEAREDGVYAYGFFNDTENGQRAATLVEHKDVTSLSIYANNLVEKNKLVVHGQIRELSLVLSGANPEALIDYVSIKHSDGEVQTLEDEAVITMLQPLEHENLEDGVDSDGTQTGDEPLAHAAGDLPADATVQDVYDSLTAQQKEVVSFMIGAALEQTGAASHSALSDDASTQEIYDSLSDQQRNMVHTLIGTAVEEAGAAAAHSATNTEGTQMGNVFEGNGVKQDNRQKLTHDQINTLIADGERIGSMKESFLQHADEYGITDIDLLFPDARLDSNGVSIISRRMEWVQNVLTNTKHSPFSRIKSVAADITADEARARGYVKGNLKKDEVVKLLRRVTTPKTIYKKQKLDRDDIIDITDLDIVAWLKAEMRVMLDEELARAILVSDGREADDDDKIDEDHIRPVAYDDDMYNTKVDLPADFAADAFIDAVVTAAKNYKGTGQPTMYTTTDVVTPLILSKDTLGRRLYNTMQDLAAALRVKEIVEVEAMEQDSDIVAIVVNLADYTVGADAGGNVAMFDDFDIDFNQQKYLIETRVSGALTKPKSAITFRRNSGRTVTPTAPTFDSATGVLTVPSETGVVYQNADTGATLSTGAQTAIAPGATIDVVATPATGYGFTHDSADEWAFQRDAS